MNEHSTYCQAAQIEAFAVIDRHSGLWSVHNALWAARGEALERNAGAGAYDRFYVVSGYQLDQLDGE